LGQLLASLPLEERLKRYRQFADEALRQAQFAQNPSLRAGYLSMAQGWQLLASEMERMMARIDATFATHNPLNTAPPKN
jgi:hypothetical protein